MKCGVAGQNHYRLELLVFFQVTGNLGCDYKQSIEEVWISNFCFVTWDPHPEIRNRHLTS